MFNFYPYEENRNSFYKKLTDNFPFIKKEVIGKSLVGREISAFTLGNKESRVIVAGAFHGSEWLTINILLHFLWDLCCSCKYSSDISGLKLKDYINGRGISIVPCVNPDGVEINLKGFSSAKGYSTMIESISPSSCRWQANARGVDINHNFPANWEKIHQLEKKAGITSPAPTRYGGKLPASEPETLALMNYCIKNDFQRCYAFHSQGREIYYSFGNNTPKSSKTLGRLFANSCGYKLASPPDIANGGGFKDWFIEKFHKPAFTFEVGKGENPLPLTDCDREYKILLKALCLTVIV
jgi:g-D-glutamyl-meso-diaminopimelate peptidase